MQTIYVVLKTDYTDPYADCTSTVVMRSFASAEAAEAEAKKLTEHARKRKNHTVYYDVESVDFENI